MKWGILLDHDTPLLEGKIGDGFVGICQAHTSAISYSVSSRILPKG